MIFSIPTMTITAIGGFIEGIFNSIGNFFNWLF